MNALVRFFGGKPAVREKVDESQTPTVVHEEGNRLQVRIEEPIQKPSPVELVGVPRCSVAVEYWGQLYKVEANDFHFSGKNVFARTTIELPSQWRVESSGRLMLVYDLKPNNQENDMIAAFANAGRLVKREFVRACLDPLTQKIVEGADRIFSY